MSSDLHKKIRDLQQRNSDLNYEVQDLNKQVKKWSTNCAYVAGTSIGIIAFLQFFSAAEPAADCSDAPIVVDQAPETPLKKVPSSNSQKTTTQPLQVKQESIPTTQAPIPSTPKPVVQEIPQDIGYDFPQQYKIKSGDSFGRIAERYYKRASLGGWLAAQNDIDPTKMRIGQEITLPAPPN